MWLLINGSFNASIIFGDVALFSSYRSSGFPNLVVTNWFLNIYFLNSFNASTIFGFPFNALLNSRTDCLTKFQDVLEQIKSFHSIFSHLSFNVIPKICNNAASLLAGSTKVNVDFSIWFEEGPTFILSIVLTELL